MSNKKALVVIDMQNDYLWSERKKMFCYDTDDLVNNVNRAILTYKEKGYDIIYISQVFPDIPTNRWIIGFSIKDTEGARLFSDLKIVSELLFDKNLSNTYTSKPFREHMRREDYSEVVICGLDECGCVGATAKGAVKTGVSVVMLENCIGRRFPDAKVQKMRRQLIAQGIKYITI
ncbi:MAG: cysteine hydrolase [Saccharofermentans sp.]|nr:cysteine hydrolase [Saccharofermentans sp.]